jgi:hypothetical protein
MMTRAYTVWLTAAILFGAAALAANAQGVQLLPEVDIYLKLNERIRLDFTAQGDRDGADSIQSQIGPSIEFYLKPLIKLKRITALDLDEAKSKALVLEVEYRTVWAPDTAITNRIVLAATSNMPLKAGVLLSDRSRVYLDWKSGDFLWRYLNKLELQRGFSIRKFHLIPYLAAEPAYLEQYSKWSTTALYAGSLFPFGRHVELDTYYEHQNDTSKKPNKQTNDIGFTCNFYFSR